MLTTSARLLRLLSLLQTPREWTGPDLAQRLEIDVRTVRRDVGKLRELGYPVDSTPGAAGGYRLGAGAVMPPLLLDDDEAVAVAVGLRAAAGVSVSGIEETSVRALAKLEQVLPARLRYRVTTLAASMVQLTGNGPVVDADVLVEVAGTCREHQRLRFDYVDRSGEQARRSVEPHRLVHTGRRWYLVAWDLDRGDWRTFRADRIRPKPPHGPRFVERPEPEGDVGTFLRRGISARAYPHRARVRLHAPAADVAQWVSPASGTVEALDDGTCVLETGAPTLDVLAMAVAAFGVEFEVLDGPELAAHLLVMARRLRTAAGPQAQIP